MPEHKTYTVCVPENKSGMRLDKFLTEAFGEFSRTRIKELIGEGLVSLHRLVEISPSLNVKEGDVYEICVPPPSSPVPKPEEIPFEVIFEDENLILVNKPAGLVVHPGAGNPDGTLVNALLGYCGKELSGIGGVSRPGIVHRLDKDTSGVLVVAKTDQAHRLLSLQFSNHTIKRAYYALVWGVPVKRCGVLETKIGRNPMDRKKMMSLTKGGKNAITNYRVTRTFGALASLIECRLLTGRTHQIRVHMSEIGHSIIGDPVYGRNKIMRKKILNKDCEKALVSFKRQALHAFLLGFHHPCTNEYLEFKADLSPDIRRLCSALKSYQI